MIQSTYQHFTFQVSDQVLIIRFSGSELRGDELVAEMQQELTAVLNEQGLNNIVLDLGNVTFVTSRWLGGLACFHRELVKEKKGQIVLCNLHPNVESILCATRFLTGKGSAPLAVVPSMGDEESAAPKVKPLFEHIAPDVDSAIAILNR